MLTLDFETFSQVNLKTRGLAAYAQNAEVLLCAYHLDGTTHLWDVTTGVPMPADLFDALHDSETQVLAHNAQFEKTILRHCLDVSVPWARWEDTMVVALTCGLPAGMNALCSALRLSQTDSKLDDGKRLINLFSKPAPRNHKLRRYTAVERPQEWEQFKRYCARDVDVTVALWAALPHWTYDKERRVWRLDQLINDRGIPFDRRLAAAAIGVLEKELKIINQELASITGGEVQQVTELHAIARWCETQGVQTQSLDKATVNSLLAGKLPDLVRRVLKLRQRAGKTSVKKFEAGIQRETAGRIYNSLQFYGAGRTGRWAGRGFQPHNMARPTENIDDAVGAIKNDTVDLLFDDPVAVASSAARATIHASTGHRLIVADLSNIEGRVRAWLAQEQWELDAYSAQDAGGLGVYEQSYARAFNVDPGTVTKRQRQIGKVMELALGYQGGPVALRTMSAAYGLDPKAFIKPVKQRVSKSKWEETSWRFDPAMASGLEPEQWTALKIIVELWRSARQRTTSFWHDVEQVALKAVQHPETVLACRQLKWVCSSHDDREYLVCKLPSGRLLNYFAPDAEIKTKTFLDPDTGERTQFDKLTLSYGGLEAHQWKRVDTYGGKLVENLTQAVARDVMVEGMLKAEANDYPVVLTVHDEVITEVPLDSNHSVEGLVEHLCNTPAWTDGLPLAASGYDDLFYRKE